VLWGLSLYALASLACAFAPSFYALLAFRALQGMTAGTGLTVGRAIIRDLYDGPEAQRLMSVGDDDLQHRAGDRATGRRLDPRRLRLARGVRLPRACSASPWCSRPG
jgi:hypothetical protein